MIKLTNPAQIPIWRPFSDVELRLDYAQVRHIVIETVREPRILARLYFGRLVQVSGGAPHFELREDAGFLDIALHDWPERRAPGDPSRIDLAASNHVAEILDAYPKVSSLKPQAYKNVGLAIEAHLLADCPACRAAGYRLEGEII